MRADRIVIKNFRSHSDTDIEFLSPVTIIHGPNASGKSSILDALHFALLGYCRGTDERGAGVKELIGDGGPGATIGLEVTTDAGLDGHPGDHHAVRVDIGANGARWPLGDQVLPAVAARAAIAATIGFDRDALHACLDVHGFLGLHHSRQKDVLLKALGLDLAEMDRQHEDAKTRRTTAKKALQALPPTQASEPRTATVSEIETQLAELRKEREGLVARRAATVGRLKAVVAELQEVELKLRDVPSKAKAEKASKEKKEAEQQLAELARMAAAIKTKVSELRAEKARLEGELGGCASALATLEKMNGKCLVSATIPCRITNEEVKRIAPTFTAAMDKLQCRIADLNNEIREQEAGLKMSSVPELEAAVARAEKVVRAFEAAVPMQESLSALKAEHEQAQAFSGPGVGEIDAQLRELAERIQTGDELLRAAIVAKADARRAIEAQVRRKGLEAELSQAEADCVVYGPSGERARLIGEKIGPFLGEAAQVLHAFGLPPIQLSLDPWDVRIGSAGESVRSAELLSTSEQMRLSLAIQIALARVTGIGLVALDGAEILDDDGRAALLTVAELGLVEHLFVVTTTAPDFEPPEIPGVQFVRVGAGAPACAVVA